MSKILEGLRKLLAGVDSANGRVRFSGFTGLVNSWCGFTEADQPRFYQAACRILVAATEPETYEDD